jgi:sucrose-6-phosphate hydrolase SacC (GH32 family)
MTEAQKEEITVNDLLAPCPLHDGRRQLTVYCDQTALEIFAGDNQVYVPFAFQPQASNLDVGVQVRGGDVKFDSLQAYELKSA